MDQAGGEGEGRMVRMEWPEEHATGWRGPDADLRSIASSIDALGRSASNALVAGDARLIQLTATVEGHRDEILAVLEELSAGRTPSFEEVREHVAAAFDVVRAATEELRTVVHRLDDVAKQQQILTETLESLVERVDELNRTDRELDAGIGRLAEEVRAYRRRTALSARPAVLANEQLQTLSGEVDRVVRARFDELLTTLAPPPPVPEPAVAATSRELKLSRKERRRLRKETKTASG